VGVASVPAAMENVMRENHHNAAAAQKKGLTNEVNKIRT